MSVDSSFSDELAYVPQQSDEDSTALARARTAAMRGVPALAFGAAAILIGGGVIAAIATGANVILSLLVGYCALASTVACLRAPAAASVQPQAIETIDVVPPAQDTAPAWKLVSTFTISDASRLLCNIEPGAAATQESIAWGRALLDAIKSGDLAIAPKAGVAQTAIDRERESPHYMTEVTREALSAWADQKGSAPAFLRG